MAQVTNQDVRSGSDSERVFEKYQPLPDRGIRLLELLPRQSRFSREDIQCNIVDAHLDRQLQYEALSYCWGIIKPDRESLTILNYGNHKFKITDSLAEAFRRFRLKDRSRFIWADFLCINQKDGKEKGRQVGMMTDIYAQASGVLAWVGTSRPEDDAAFAGEEARKTGPGGLDHAVALGRFLERAWFSRMWIIQEAAIARRLELHCGNKKMEWSEFCRILQKMLTEHGFMLNTSRTDAGLDRIMTMLSIRNLVTEHVDMAAPVSQDFRVLKVDQLDQQRPNPSLLQGDFARFANHTRLFGATDQRDRIYALRGLVLNAEKGSLPDYGKSEPQLFQEFTLQSMVLSQSLNMLSQAGIHENDLPSWVPDWSRRLDVYPLNVEAYQASPVRFAHEASRAGTLAVTGHLIDRITLVQPGFDNFERPPGNGPAARNRRWTPGEQPSHERLEIFERSISESLEVLSPFAHMLTDGVSGVKHGPKFVKELVSKAAAIPNAMKNRTRRITNEDEQAWQNLALGCGSSGRYADAMAAYRETLLGGMPIPALAPELDSRFRDTMCAIWRERSAENPIVNRGFTSAHNWKGQTKSGERPVPCPAELKVAYFDGVGKKNSDSAVQSNREQFKQTGGTEFRPVLTDRKVYEATKGMKNLFKGKGKKEENVEERMTEYEKKLAYYDNADPWFKANDDREAKQYLARLYSREVERMAGHRKFAVTQSGYMGWMPEIAREGDELWILEGGNVPYILRRVGREEDYELVGEAYVQGLMMGEWFQGRNRDQILDQRMKVVIS